MAFKIYSIESRKGGVGKTTIALNLAKALKGEGQPVLLLDCDITGTSISEPAQNSPFWAEDTNVLKDDKRQPYNLIGFFLEKFIRGMGDVGLYLPADKLLRDKINVIGSDIYRVSSQAHVDSRLLMDELHCYWQKEMIAQIVDRFQVLFPEDTVNIVIDNSPGYVGLCQSLHNYMFSLGPKTAKFLMVSSMDAQDMQACVSAGKLIKQSIEDRYDIAGYYTSLSEGAAINNDIEKKLEQDSNLKKFFLRLSENEEFLNAYGQHKPDVNTYLTLVINKMPRRISERNVEINFEDIVGAEDIDLFKAITSADENEFPKTFVNYSELISYQYYLKYIKNTKKKTVDEKYWKDRYKSLEEQNQLWHQNDDRMKALSTLSLLYGNLIKSLNDRNNQDMASSLDEAWNPSYALDTLKQQIISWTDKLYQIPVDHLSDNIIQNLHDWNNDTLQTVRTIPGIGKYWPDVSALFTHIEASANYGKERQSVALMLLVSIFLQASAGILSTDKAPTADMHEFLKAQIAGQGSFDWQRFIQSTVFVCNQAVWNTDLMRPLMDELFPDFHRSFCRALLRMIDAHSDFEAVVSAVRLYVPSDSPEELPNQMKEYLNHVIIEKSEPYDKQKLLGLKTSSMGMIEVQNVIIDIVLSSWSL